jgi:hypothetical protein
MMQKLASDQRRYSEHKIEYHLLNFSMAKELSSRRFFLY